MVSRAGKVHLKHTPEQLRSAGVLLDESITKGPLDLLTMFSNRRPVEIEIGPGKGSFLLRRATVRPEVNFLGIEWARKYAWYVADRAYRAGLANVRVLAADAETVFARCLPHARISRIHIYFPDPWPKTRHLRRRLLKPGFLAEVRQVLLVGGWLGIVTDHEGYFRQIQNALATTHGLTVVPFAGPTGSEGSFVGTNFENKYASAGRGFRAIAALRCG